VNVHPVVQVFHLLRLEPLAPGDEDGDTAASDDSKQPPAPRPLSPDDLVLRKALELLKNPVKKAA
jgi:hypothetical protein